jgi:hypothetical protein
LLKSKFSEHFAKAPTPNKGNVFNACGQNALSSSTTFASYNFTSAALTMCARKPDRLGSLAILLDAQAIAVLESLL